MIYTVTCNPAIDYYMRIPGSIAVGGTNKSVSEQLLFGGKGINVSYVLGQLGIESRALGFAAGFTGEALLKGIRSMGLQEDFVMLEEGLTRINVKVCAEKETEFNGAGPAVSPDKLEQFFQKLDGIRDGDGIVLSGSVPTSLPKDLYERILERLSDRRVLIVADAEGALLKGTLKYHPFLVKPNRAELSAMFGMALTSEAQIMDCARQLLSMGAQTVLVSLDEDGSLLVKEGASYRMDALHSAPVVSATGAGDSMIAGFLAGHLQGMDTEDALRLASAAASATVFSDGLARETDIKGYMEELQCVSRI